MTSASSNIGLPRWDSSLFEWVTWRSGSITEVFNIPHRYPTITENADLLRKYAVAWCPSDMVPCRPKVGYISVMFELDDGRQFWTHLTEREFLKVFPDRES